MKASRIFMSALGMVVMASIAAFSAVPGMVNYQGYLKNADGTPVNSAVSVRFSLYSSTRAGSGPVWRETKSVTPSNGIYSTQLGSTTPITAPFDVPYWLGVKVEGDAEMALQQLSSVPYARRADAADSAYSVAGLNLASLDGRYLDPMRPVPNQQQLATLRWDQLRNGKSTFATGDQPVALVFDGSSVWVANWGSGDVTRINTVTGSSISIPVGSHPGSLAYDGSYIWVANQYSNNLMKIDPNNNTVTATVNLPNSPYGIAFDGRFIWVTMPSDASIAKIDPANNSIVATLLPDRSAVALIFDGTYVLAANNDNTNDISKIDPTNNTVVASIQLGASIMGLAFDGMFIWGTDRISNNVYKIDPRNNSLSEIRNYGVLPYAVAVDGSFVWVTDLVSGTVMKINPFTNQLLATIPTGRGPAALAYDGRSIWVANANDNTVTKLIAAGEPVGIQAVGEAQLADGAISAAKVSSGAIKTNHLDDLSITTNKIADSAVTEMKLADGAVTDAKIGGIISPGKGGTGINPSSTMPGSMLSTTGSGLWGVLPPGTEGNALKVIGGLPAWADGNTVNGTMNILAGSAGAKGLVVKGVANQSANLQEWQNSTGTPVASVSAGGVLTGDGSGLSGIQKKYGKVAVVAKSGGDYTSPLDAMSAIGSWCGVPSAENTCLLKLMAGKYELYTSSLEMQPFVDLEGSGEFTTTITSAPQSTWAGTIEGVDNSEIRFLTVESRGHGYGIFYPPKLSNVTVKAAKGIYVGGSSAIMKDVSVFATYIGLEYDESSSQLINSSITMTCNTECYGVKTYGTNTSPILSGVTINVSGSNSSWCYGIHNDYLGSTELSDVSVMVTGPGNNYGVYFQNSSQVLTGVVAKAFGGIENYGLYAYNPSDFILRSVSIDRSSFEGSTASVKIVGYFKVRIGASKLIGNIYTPVDTIIMASYTDSTTLDPNFRADSNSNIIIGNLANSVSGEFVYGATVSGGGNNQHNCYDHVSGTYTAACANTASNNYATVSGGNANTASGEFSVVSGGTANSASDRFSAVGGGTQNTAVGLYSTISGGYHNNANYGGFVGGGSYNVASGYESSVVGGGNNIASGSASVVAGGHGNQAGGHYSFSAGFRAIVRNSNESGDSSGDEGSFVWADSQNADFVSTGANQFLIRAAGGVGINKNNPATALDVSGTVTASQFSGSGSGLTGLDAANISAGQLAIARGGTNTITIGAAGSTPYSTGTAYAFSAAGAVGQILHSGGAGSPTWGAVDLASVSQVTGTLSVINGGTGAANAAAARTSLAVPGLAVANTFTVGGQVIQTGAAATRGLTIQGAASQSANLQEWQNSAGTALASISSAGTFTGNGSGLTSLNAANVSSGVLPVSRGGTGSATQNFVDLSNNQTVGGSKTFSSSITASGGARISDQQIYMRGGTDTFHGVGWYATGDFVSGNPDGPVLYGCAGGSLGTSCGGNKMALNWDSSGNVHLSGTLDVASIPASSNSYYLCSSSTNSGRVERCASSSRLKENILDLPFGLEIIRQLRPVSFTWKANGNKDVGFIAEEVAESNPVLAIYNEQGEPDGVKYANMSAVLVKAMQEQQALIKAQGNMIKELKAELETLKQTVGAK